MKWTIETSPGDMLIFEAVVRHGSFTRAAQHLGLTKQAVSARVLRLERALQVRLLQRTTRRLRPTEAGVVYFERCQSIAAQIAEANDVVQQRQSEPTGTLRVASPTLFGRRLLSPVLARYLALYPNMRVAVTLTDRRIDLIADGVDVAIQIGALADSSYTARRLGEGHLYIVASPAFLEQHGPIPVDSLSRVRCVGYRTHEHWRVNATRVAISPTVVMNNLESVCELAVAGVGIARLPGLVCRDALLDGRLIQLFPESQMSTRPISVVYPSRVYQSAKVSRFVDLLSTMIAPTLPL